MNRAPDSPEQPGSAARAAAWTLVALLVALALHGIVAWQYRADPFAQTLVSDALSYHLWAVRIAEHGLAAEPVFHQSPLFPLVLSWLYAITPEDGRTTVSALAQILLGSLAIALLVPIGRSYLNSTAAGLAGALLALAYGPFVFYGMKLFPVPLALATQAAALATLGAARQRPTPLRAALAGVCLGLACLARAELLLFVPLALLALAGPLGRGADATPRRRLAIPAIGLVAALAVIAPVTLHNLRQGDLVPIASAAGENLFIGNQVTGHGGYTQLHPRAGEIFAQREQARLSAENAAGRELRPSEVSAYWRGKAWRELRESPAAWIGLESRKLGRILHPGDPTDVYSFALERSLYLSALYLLPATAWCVLLLGAIGGFCAWNRCRNRAWPLGALVGVHFVVLLVFFVDSRLRLPLLFFLTPFGGLAIVEGARLWRAGRQRIAVATLASLTVLSLIVGASLTTWSPRDVVRVAAVLSQQGRLDDSLAVLARVTTSPDPDARALDQAGWVLQKKKDFAAAREHYERALERGLTGSAERQTRTRLGMVCEQLEDHSAAAREHDLAAAHPTANSGTFFERGMFRLRRGQRDAAVKDLREAVRRDPYWPEPQEVLRRLGKTPR